MLWGNTEKVYSDLKHKMRHIYQYLTKQSFPNANLSAFVA